MAVDFSKGMTRKAPKSQGRMSYSDAKQKSLDNLDKAIDAVHKHIKKFGALPTGNQMPAGLVKAGAEGEPCIGWRIANKPVHFNQESKDAYYPCSDWEADLRSLAKEIAAGKHEDVLVEAYERKTKEPTEGMREKREARNAAKQRGEANFTWNGNTYSVKTGRKV